MKNGKDACERRSIKSLGALSAIVMQVATIDARNGKYKTLTRPPKAMFETENMKR